MNEELGRGGAKQVAIAYACLTRYVKMKENLSFFDLQRSISACARPPLSFDCTNFTDTLATVYSPMAARKTTKTEVVWGMMFEKKGKH